MGHCLGSFGAMMPRDKLRTPSVRTHVYPYIDTQNNPISFQSNDVFLKPSQCRLRMAAVR